MGPVPRSAADARLLTLFTLSWRLTEHGEDQSETGDQVSGKDETIQ